MRKASNFSDIDSCHQFGKLSACLCILFLYFFHFSTLRAQNQLLIHSIQFAGDDKVKKQVLLRELPFLEGDSIPMEKLPELFTLAEERLRYTYLYKDVKCNFVNTSPMDDRGVMGGEVQIELQKRNRIFFYPLFELADRNFNVWWDDFDRDLKRINLGLEGSHINLTGRRDYLVTKLQLGFTRKVEIIYELPGLLSAPKWGYELQGLWASSKSVRINTLQNKEQFFGDLKEEQIRRLRLGMKGIYRPGYRHKFSLGLTFYDRHISAAAAAENPYFFGDALASQRYFSANFVWEQDGRNDLLLSDNATYSRLEVIKNGLDFSFLEARGINNLRLIGHFEKHFKSGKFHHVLTLHGSAILGGEFLPYYNRRALGYAEDMLVGYDYYLVDGRHFAYIKNCLRYELFRYKIDLGKMMPIKSLRLPRFRVFVGFQWDMAYADNRDYPYENSFSNQLLLGLAPRLDILYNETVMGTAMLGINHLGEPGLYFRVNSAF